MNCEAVLERSVDTLSRGAHLESQLFHELCKPCEAAFPPADAAERLPINLTGFCPIYLEERELIPKVGLEAFRHHDQFDFLTPTRPNWPRSWSRSAAVRWLCPSTNNAHPSTGRSGLTHPIQKPFRWEIPSTLRHSVQK